MNEHSSLQPLVVARREHALATKHGRRCTFGSESNAALEVVLGCAEAAEFADVLRRDLGQRVQVDADPIGNCCCTVPHHSEEEFQ